MITVLHLMLMVEDIIRVLLELLKALDCFNQIIVNLWFIFYFKYIQEQIKNKNVKISLICNTGVRLIFYIHTHYALFRLCFTHIMYMICLIESIWKIFYFNVLKRFASKPMPVDLWSSEWTLGAEGCTGWDVSTSR